MGETVIARALHMVAFPHGVCRPPCIANACTARVCIADQVVVTERSRASGGSDPCEGWAPSRAEAGRILTSVVWAKWPHPWHTSPEDGASPNEAAVRGARLGCNPSVRCQPCARLSMPCTICLFFYDSPIRAKMSPAFLHIRLSPRPCFQQSYKWTKTVPQNKNPKTV